MKSGSTLLLELLSKGDKSLILCEPRFKGKKFKLNKQMIEQANKIGYTGPHEGDISFIVCELCKHVEQVGVKEIRNKGWESYVSAFNGNIRVIIPTRDYRDIYISAYNQCKRSRAWVPLYGMSPEGLKKEIFREVVVQHEIKKHAPTLEVKYEELCSDFDAKYNEILEFTESPIKTIGEVGSMHDMLARGEYEVGLHNFDVTTKSVSRWKNETDEKLLEDANIFNDLMNESIEIEMNNS